MSKPAHRQFLDVFNDSRPSSVSGALSMSDLVMGGLTDDQLWECPERLNSIAWLLWHVTRCDDVWQTYQLGGGSQLLDEGWAERLRMRWRDIGTGMTRSREGREVSLAIVEGKQVTGSYDNVEGPGYFCWVPR